MIWLASCAGPPIGPEPTDPPAPPHPILAVDGPAPRNLLMISIDTLRTDRLARFGGTGQAPFLDSLLARSVVLDDHVGCSNWTFHAATCTVAGADPIHLGFVPAMGPTSAPEPLPEGHAFLSTWLSRAGLQTVLVTTNPVFSEVYGSGGGYDVHVLLPEGIAASTEQAAAVFMDQLAALDAERPFFAHLHVSDPHRPYVPPDAYRLGWDPPEGLPHDLDTAQGHDDAIFEAMTTATPSDRLALQQHLEQRYDSAVTWLDDQLADLWADLEAAGWLDDAWVVVWSDHGEQHFERGYQAHAYTLFREENDVLGLLWAPDLSPGAWGQPTAAIDLAPTILDLFGVSIPDTVTGVPIGSADPQRRRFSFTYGKVGRFQAVRQGPDKLMFGWSDPATLPGWQQPAQGIHQYDVVADPREITDRYDPSTARTQQLWGWLRPQIEAASALLPQEAVAWPADLP